MKKHTALTTFFLLTALLTGCAAGKTQDFVSAYQKEDIPETYAERVGKVTFDMEVTVPENIWGKPLMQARAVPKKADGEEAYRMFMDGREEETEEGKAVNEFGKKTAYRIYFAADSENLSVGPYSSNVSYGSSKVNEIHQIIDLEHRFESYNGDLFRTETDLEFGSREEIAKEVLEVSEKLGVLPESYEMTFYVLDRKTLEPLAEEKKEDDTISAEEWAERNEGYYLAIQQTYGGLPLFHFYFKTFEQYEDANAPIQVIFTKNGIANFNSELTFDIKDERTCKRLIPFEEAVDAAAEKYNRLLTDEEYIYHSAALYYMADVHSGRNSFPVFPVWVLEGTSNAEDGTGRIQIIVNAVTGDEVK